MTITNTEKEVDFSNSEIQLTETLSALQVVDQETYNKANILIEECDRVLDRIA